MFMGIRYLDRSRQIVLRVLGFCFNEASMRVSSGLGCIWGSNNLQVSALGRHFCKLIIEAN